MPKLNSRGQMAAGVAGGIISVDNVPVAAGGCAHWLTDTQVIFGGPNVTGAWVTRVYDTTTTKVTDLDPRGANFIGAGGGRYAAMAGVCYGNFTFTAGSRTALCITDSRSPATDDGAIALCPDPSCTSFDVYWPDSTKDHVAAVAYNLCIVGKGQYVWDGGQSGYAVNVPVPMVRRRIVKLADGDWIVGWNNTYGVIAMLNGAKDGYVVVKAPNLAYYHDARAINGELHVCWSTTQGEAPGTNFHVIVDRSQPRVPIAPRVSVPGIGKPCLLAWFSDRPTSAPGNATLNVAFNNNEQGDNLVRVQGVPVASLVDVESGLSDLEAGIAAARAKNPGLPVVVYWPPSFWGQTCSADIIGVQAYQTAGEASGNFESEVLSQVVRHKRVWIVAQGYNSNPSHTLDTADVVPVIANLVRQNSNVDGILAFSAGTRPGGWDALDAETQQAWQDLFTSITGVPNVNPVSSLKPAAVQVNAFTLTKAANLPDGVVFELVDPNNPQLGTKVRGFVQNGSIYFSIDYPGAGPNLAGQTAKTRPVR